MRKVRKQCEGCGKSLTAWQRQRHSCGNVRVSFTFPDGHEANSKTIDTEKLRAHGIRKFSGGHAFWHGSTDFNSLASGQLSEDFHLDENGRADRLHLEIGGPILGSVSFKQHNLLGKADGSRFFDFPMTKEEIEELFGLPAQTKRETGVFWIGH